MWVHIIHGNKKVRSSYSFICSPPPPLRNVSAHEQDRKGLQVQQSTRICVPIWQTGCELQEGRTHTHLSRSPLDLHSCPGAWQRAAPKNVGWFSEKGRRNRWTWGTPNSWRRPKDHLDDLRRNWKHLLQLIPSKPVRWGTQTNSSGVRETPGWNPISASQGRNPGAVTSLAFPFTTLKMEEQQRSPGVPHRNARNGRADHIPASQWHLRKWVCIRGDRVASKETLREEVGEHVPFLPLEFGKCCYNVAFIIKKTEWLTTFLKSYSGMKVS